MAGMGLLVLIIIVVALLIAIIDWTLGFSGTGRRFALLPLSVILLCVALIIEAVTH